MSTYTTAKSTDGINWTGVAEILEMEFYSIV